MEKLAINAKDSASRFFMSQ